MSNATTARLRRFGAVLAATVFAAGCATVPPEEDPVQLKLTDLEARMIRVERVLDNQVEMLRRLEQLQQETQQLRGEIETLKFETESGAERQRQQYVDLDERLQTIEKRGLAAAPGVVASGDSAGAVSGTLAAGMLPVPGGGDRANYQAAFDMLKDGRYEESANAFRQFLIAFPDSALADNAQYWLAETYYVTREFEQALPAFQKVVGQYPESRKIPDALLKIGYCNYELKRWQAAREALRQVVAEYSDTTAARLATQRLERMNEEGR